MMGDELRHAFPFIPTRAWNSRLSREAFSGAFSVSSSLFFNDEKIGFFLLIKRERKISLRKFFHVNFLFRTQTCCFVDTV